MEGLTEDLPIQVPKQRTSSINASATPIPLPRPSGSILKSAPISETLSTGNNSVEDFFFTAQNSPPPPSLLRSQSHTVGASAVSAATQSGNYGSIIVNHSTPGLALNSPDLQNSNGLEDYREKLGQATTGGLQKSHSSTSFIPKSRVNSPPPNSVTDSLSIRKKPFDTTVLKRVPQKSNLKFTIDDDVDEFENATSKADDETKTQDLDNDDETSSQYTDKYADIDDGYNSNRHYDIPKFGGFSNKKLMNKEEKSNIFDNSELNVIEFAKGNGALKNAIKSSLEDGIVNDYCWLGTIGIPTDELSQKTREKITKTLKNEHQCESVLPDDFTFQGAYKNFCKEILWPTLHYQIPDNPKSKAFEDHSWEYYRSLNQEFADKIVEIYKDGDTIWVHDYHLLLVPKMVREKLPNAQIGFFLHVSFPSSEVFRCFAQREKLLEGILGANSISFQTDEYVRHFLQTCNKLLLADVSENELRYKGQTVKVCSLPVGIDAAKLRKQILSQGVVDWRHMIRERWAGKKLIVARDKFDRIRGVKQKLLAYEDFLGQNPEYIEDTVLIQICLKSSSVDTELESEIMSIVDRINGLSHNISNIQPVVFLHQDIDFVQYLALIAEADTFIVSSMREGMNLTCHEFIVATTEKQSPLILSEFTGSAAVFTKGAIIINPWNIKEMSHCIKRALTMSPEEKNKNWNLLYDVVSHQDCDYWVQSSLEFIKDSWKYQQEKKTHLTLDVERFTSAYKNATNKLFIFLLSNVPTERVLRILYDLSAENDVYVLSTEKRVLLERLYRRIPKLGLIAESGNFLKLKNADNWLSLANENVSSWLETTQVVAKSYEERLPQSKAELDEATLKFHTEDVAVQDKERKDATIGDLIAHVNSTNQNIHATLVNGTVFIQQSDITMKAITFLIEYLTKTGTLSDDVHPMSAPPSPVSSKSEEPFNAKPLDFLLIGGEATNLFEPILEYANELGSDGDVKDVFTIAFGGSVSNAKEHVVGLNELFTVVMNTIA